MDKNLKILALLGIAAVFVALFLWQPWQPKDKGKFILLDKSLHYNQPEAVLLKNGKLFIVDAIQEPGNFTSKNKFAAQIFDPNLKKYFPIDLGVGGHYPVKINEDEILLLSGQRNKLYKPSSNTLQKINGKLPILNNIYSAHLLRNNDIFIIGFRLKDKFYDIYAWVYNWRTATYDKQEKLNTFSLQDRPCVKSNILSQDKILLLIGGGPLSKKGLSGLNKKPKEGVPNIILKYFNDCPEIVALDNGKFFILSEDKIYFLDPKTEKMIKLREHTQYKKHETATLLTDGRVLLTGGLRYSPSLGDLYCAEHPEGAEIFDPHTEIVTRTGNLNIARTRHKVFSLSNGQALVVSGTDQSDCEFDNKAEKSELFIPK